MAWPDRLQLLLHLSLLAAADFGRHQRACGGLRLKGLLRQAGMQGCADMTVTCDPAEGDEDSPVHLCLGVTPADASGGEQLAPALRFSALKPAPIPWQCATKGVCSAVLQGEPTPERHPCFNSTVFEVISCAQVFTLRPVTWQPPAVAVPAVQLISSKVPLPIHQSENLFVCLQLISL